MYVEGFNSQMLAEAKSRWAVAIPVSGRFEGDPQPGQPVSGHRFLF